MEHGLVMGNICNICNIYEISVQYGLSAFAWNECNIYNVCTMILVDRSQVCVGGDLSPAPLGGSCNVGSAPLHPRKTLPRAKTEISPSLVALMPLLSPSSAPHPSIHRSTSKPLGIFYWTENSLNRNIKYHLWVIQGRDATADKGVKLGSKWGEKSKRVSPLLLWPGKLRYYLCESVPLVIRSERAAISVLVLTSVDQDKLLNASSVLRLCPSSLWGGSIHWNILSLDTLRKPLSEPGWESQKIGYS